MADLKRRSRNAVCRGSSAGRQNHDNSDYELLAATAEDRRWRQSSKQEKRIRDDYCVDCRTSFKHDSKGRDRSPHARTEELLFRYSQLATVAQREIVGNWARMRAEKSGASSAACAPSLIKERRRNSSNGNVVSTRPE